MTNKIHLYIIHHMEIVEVKNLRSLLHASKYIGRGTTSICFLLSNGEVLKLYSKWYKNTTNYKVKGVKKHLDSLSSINNESYIAPDRVYIKDNEIIGYGMRFAPGKVLHRIKSNTNLEEIFPLIDKLLDDTIEISNQGFRLGDLHDRNIILGDQLSVIDLDNGKFLDTHKYGSLVNYNINDVIETLYFAIFKLNEYEKMEFYDQELERLHKLTAMQKIRAYKELLIKIKEELNLSTLTVKDIRYNKRKLIYTIDVSDYKAHF